MHTGSQTHHNYFIQKCTGLKYGNQRGGFFQTPGAFLKSNRLKKLYHKYLVNNNSIWGTIHVCRINGVGHFIVLTVLLLLPPWSSVTLWCSVSFGIIQDCSSQKHMVGDNVDQCTVRCRVSAESWYRTSQVCNWALGQCYLTVLQPEVIFTHCVEFVTSV